MNSPIYKGSIQAITILEWRSRRKFTWLLVVGCIAAAFESIGVAFAFGLIRLILDPSSVDSIPILRRIVTGLGLEMTGNVLLFAAVAMGVFFTIKNLFLAFAAYFQEKFLNSATTEIAHRLMQRYLLTPYELVFHRNSADLIIGVTSASYGIASRILSPTVTIITECLIIISIAAVLFISEPRITLITMGLLGAIGAGYYFSTTHLFRHWGKEQLRYEEALTKNIYESLQSLKEIKILVRERFFIGKFLASRNKLTRVLTLSQSVKAMPRLITEAVVMWAMVIVIVLVLSGERPVETILSTLGLFAFAGFRMMPSINRLTMALATLKQGKPSLERISNDLNVLRIEDDSSTEDGAKNKRLAFMESLELRNVSFSYLGSVDFALTDISFRISRGESLGVVGQTGAGKSTLVDIILGLLKPQYGTISLDSQKLDTGSGAWKRMLGYVPQEIFLMDDTLCRNIALGLPDHEINEERMEAVARMAALERVVSALPEGFDTVIGERGTRLSGGQRQRIGIARALYHDPEILLMDEATSALDSETEYEIIEAVERLAGKKTVIVIAHRLSTVRHCNGLLFMKDGRLVDTGTFEEVRQRNSDFANMVRLAEVSGATLDQASN